jgi:hypothetical protein
MKNIANENVSVSSLLRNVKVAEEQCYKISQKVLKSPLTVTFFSFATINHPNIVHHQLRYKI